MSQFIDTIISLIFVYFVFSNLASVLVEIWNHYYKKRHKDLESAIKHILDDTNEGNPDFTIDFYGHHSINTIKRNLDSLPAYISDEHFAAVVIDIFAELGAGAGSNFVNFMAGVRGLNGAGLKRLLLSLGTSVEALPADKQDEQLKINIKNWYNDYMDRVTGWYKKDLRVQLLTASVGLTIFFNIDTIKLVKTFYNDDELRNEIVLSAIEVTGSIQPDSLRVRSFEEESKLEVDQRNLIIKQGFSLLDSLNEVPLGWIGRDQIIKQEVVALMVKHKVKPRSFKSDEKALKLGLEKIDKTLRRCLQSGKCYVELEDKKVKTSYEKEPCNCLTEYYSSRDSMDLLVQELMDRKGVDAKRIKSKRKEFQISMESKYEIFPDIDILIYSFKDGLDCGWTIIGWLISILAVSRGATFWFDNLVKLVNIRSAGVKPKAVK